MTEQIKHRGMLHCGYPVNTKHLYNIYTMYTMYKCYTNVLCLSGNWSGLPRLQYLGCWDFTNFITFTSDTISSGLPIIFSKCFFALSLMKVSIILTYLNHNNVRAVYCKPIPKSPFLLQKIYFTPHLWRRQLSQCLYGLSFHTTVRWRHQYW